MGLAWYMTGALILAKQWKNARRIFWSLKSLAI